MLRVGLFGVMYLTACRSDNVIETKINRAPTIAIMSHGDGAEFQEGFTEYFRAVATDADNEFDELSVVWYVGEDVVCDWDTVNSAGESLCDIIFEEGDTNIIAEIQDAEGAGGRSEIAISVVPTEPPLIDILAPTDGNSYYSNQLIQFSATVSDLEDAPEDLLVSWISNVDGLLALDNSINSDDQISDYTYLSEGNHAVELRVEDSTGKVSTDEVVIQVGGENYEPTCSLSSPIDGAAFVVGESIVFSGTATDDNIPNTDLTASIESNLDGLIQTIEPNSDGSFSFATSDLNMGTHTVTLLVSDEVGTECRTSMLIAVGNPPVATIDEPVDGSLFSVGDTITFRGTVLDDQDPANQIAVVWNSDLDGVLNSGSPNAQGVAQFTRLDLSAGVHSVTLTATDSTGLMNDDLVSFRVNTLPVVDSIVLSPDPTYSDDALIVTTSGSDVDGQNVSIAYEWFENGTLTGFTAPTIAATEIQVGETWTVRATPNDGFQDGIYVEETVVISNTNPTITTPTISPSSGTLVNSLLTCNASGSDLDDGVLTPTYTWTSSSGVTTTGPTWQLDASQVNVSDTITCTASVTDNNGAVVTSSTSVVLENNVPVSSGIAISPNTGVITDSILTCSAGFTDAEDGVLSPTYEWTVGGNSLSTSDTYTVDADETNVGDTLICTALVTDADENTATDSDSVVIENTAPVISGVTISPSSAITNDATLTCTATVSDIDESVSPFFAWKQNGTEIATGPTIDLSMHSIVPGDSIECEATVTDSNMASASGTGTVGIGNRSPSASVPILSNMNPVMNDILTCSTVATDLDGDNTTVAYTWMNGTTPISNTDTVTLTPNNASVGDVLVCSVVVTDDHGATGGSAQLTTVVNTEPTIADVAVTSSENGYYNSSIFTCVATVDDPDQHSSIAYTWSSSIWGLLTNTPTIDLSTEAFLPADILTCTVDVTDDDDGTVITQIETVVIDNRAPTAPTVDITWSGNGLFAMEGDALTCTASGSVDTDGESVSYAYSWLSTVSGPSTGQTIAGTYTLDGDTWTCVVTATDGTDSTTGSDSAAITSVCNLTECDTNIDLSGGMSIDMNLILGGLEPRGTYTLTNDFYMMTTEVTQGMFNALMSYDPVANGTIIIGFGPDYPVYYVNWHMAADFANSVTARHNTVYGTALQECYTCTDSDTEDVRCMQTADPYQCTGYVLPTDAEWEYAKRSGSLFDFWTPSGGGNYTSNGCNGTEVINDYSGASLPLIQEYAWYCGNNDNAYGVRGAKEVAQKLPNGFGLYDMHGNLWEWTADWNGCAQPQSGIDPFCAVISSKRIRRGGSWIGTPAYLRSSYRASYIPEDAGSKIGFRLAIHP